MLITFLFLIISKLYCQQVQTALVLFRSLLIAMLKYQLKDTLQNLIGINLEYWLAYLQTLGK